MEVKIFILFFMEIYEKNCTLDLLLERHTYRQVFTGWSGAAAYYLPGLSAYLKIAPVESLSNLAREKEVLEWLDGKLPVPKVLDFEVENGRQFILISEIRGLPVSEYVAEHRQDPALIHDLIVKTAQAMRLIHDLPLKDCSLPLDIDVALAAARENIRRNFVNESDFDVENQGRAAADIYEELVEKKPLSEDLVFTHGDFCLPNFMILDNEISGFIDLDRGGVADRYQDIALFLRSFAFNIEIQMDISKTFCSAYGIDSLDEEKMHYYRLLDELF
jgi:aminoglycoside phosphotransferase